MPSRYFQDHENTWVAGPVTVLWWPSLRFRHELSAMCCHHNHGIAALWKKVATLMRCKLWFFSMAGMGEWANIFRTLYWMATAFFVWFALVCFSGWGCPGTWHGLLWRTCCHLGLCLPVSVHHAVARHEMWERSEYGSTNEGFVRQKMWWDTEFGQYSVFDLKWEIYL